jgi:hypothetical protein
MASDAPTFAVPLGFLGIGRRERRSRRHHLHHSVPAGIPGLREQIR